MIVIVNCQSLLKVAVAKIMSILTMLIVRQSVIALQADCSVSTANVSFKAIQIVADYFFGTKIQDKLCKRLD